MNLHTVEPDTITWELLPYEWYPVPNEWELISMAMQGLHWKEQRFQLIVQDENVGGGVSLIAKQLELF